MLSVRDLVRQIPAEWQENVKHRSGLSYGRFLDQIQDPDREDSRIATWFWGVQEIPDILNRWGHDLPPERVHLVTVPPPGGPPDLLWERFSTGLRARRPRPRPGGGARQPLARRAGDGAAAADQPVGQPGARAGRLPAAGARAAGPPDAVAAAQVAAARAAAGRAPVGPGPRRGPGSSEIEGRGYDVVGDLDDLVGPAGDREVRRPRPTRRAPGRRRRRRLDQGAAARERPAAPRGGGARRGAGRDPEGARALLPAADVPAAREDRPPAPGEPGPPGAVRSGPTAFARGRSSRSA